MAALIEASSTTKMTNYHKIADPGSISTPEVLEAIAWFVREMERNPSETHGVMEQAVIFASEELDCSREDILDALGRPESLDEAELNDELRAVFAYVKVAKDGVLSG